MRTKGWCPVMSKKKERPAVPNKNAKKPSYGNEEVRAIGIIGEEEEVRGRELFYPNGGWKKLYVKLERLQIKARCQGC